MMKVFLFLKAARAEQLTQLQGWLSTSYLEQLLEAGLPLSRYILNTCDIVPQFKISPFIASGPAHSPTYDFGAELWVESEKNGVANSSADFSDPELQKFFLAQEKILQAYSSRVDVFFTSEIVHYTPSPAIPTDIKFMALGRWVDNLTSIEGRQYWSEHAKLVPRIHVGVNKYVQNWVENTPLSDSPIVSGIAELHFPSIEKMETEFYNSVEGQNEIRQDVARFTKSAITLFAHETLIYQKPE